MVELHNYSKREDLSEEAFNEKYDSIRIEFTGVKHSVANRFDSKILEN